MSKNIASSSPTPLSDAHGTEGGAFGRLAELGIGGQPAGERESVHGISLPC